MQLTVLGAGAWGTALAMTFARRHAVRLYVRDLDQAACLERERENRRYLPGCAFPETLTVERDVNRALAGAQAVVVATPLAGLRAALQSVRDAKTSVPVLWACKGLEADSGMLPHQIAAEVLGAGWPSGALTGPSFAAEVARGLPTALVLASNNAAWAREMSSQLHQPHLRVYANDDVVGAEVGGAVKNVMAIAAGIADGMGFGLNSRAALITRGLAEMARLGLALGARRDTFLGLTGMGDLILTCTGDTSRNRRVGLKLAQGVALPTVLAELGHVAEGVPTTREVAQLASRLGVDMPITQAMDGILFHGLSAEDAVGFLLIREPGTE